MDITHMDPMFCVLSLREKYKRHICVKWHIVPMQKLQKPAHQELLSFLIYFNYFFIYFNISIWLYLTVYYSLFTIYYYHIKTNRNYAFCVFHQSTGINVQYMHLKITRSMLDVFLSVMLVPFTILQKCHDALHLREQHSFQSLNTT